MPRRQGQGAGRAVAAIGRTPMDPDAEPDGRRPTTGADADGEVVRRAPFSDNPQRRRPGPAHPAAHPRRRPAGLRRGGLPPVQHRPHHQAGRLLAGVLLPVLLRARRTCSATSRGRWPASSSASTEALGPLTPDADGWTAMRAWVARYADDLRALRAGVPGVPAGGRRATRRSPAGRSARASGTSPRFRSRLAPTTLPPRQLDPVIAPAAGVPDPHARRRRASCGRPTPDALPAASASRTPSPTSSTARCSACSPPSTCTRPPAAGRRCSRSAPPCRTRCGHDGDGPAA